MKPRYFFMLACIVMVSLSQTFGQPLRDEAIKRLQSLKDGALVDHLKELYHSNPKNSINWTTFNELQDYSIQLDTNSRIITNTFLALKLIRGKKVYEAYKLFHQTGLLLSKSENFAKAYYYSSYARAYSILLKPDSTIYYARKSLDIAYKIKNTDLIHCTLNLLAKKSYEFGLYKESIEYRKQISTLDPKDNLLQRNSFHNIGMAFFHLNQYDSSRYYLKKSLQVSEQLNDIFWIGLDNGNIGITYLEEKRYEEALPYLLIDLKFSQLEGITESTMNCLHHLVDLSVKSNKLVQGQTYFSMLMTAFHQVKLTPDQTKTQKLKFYKTASVFYEASEQFQKAFNYHKAYTNLYRDLEESNNKNNSTLLSAWSDYENLIRDNQRKESTLKIKEQQILLLKKEKQLQFTSKQLITYLLIGAAVLLILSTGILYGLYERYMYNKGARKTLEVQRDEISHKNDELSKNLHLLEYHQEKLKKLTRHLTEVNVTKDKLFSIIGHDLRTPIANLKSLVQLLSSRKITQDEFMQISGNLSQNIEHVFYTLENLLQWANGQLQGFQSDPQPIDLHDLVQENIDFLIAAAQSKEIILSNQICKNSLVRIDKNQMSLVFRNLITNAIKFTPTQGSVELSAQADEKEFKIAIADNGIGMSKEDQCKLFRHNTHFSTYGTNGEKGTGLGLILCEEMIAKNGGSISVKSEPGQGTTFWITLPKVAVVQN